jgi:hypothetical protein
MSRTTSVTSGLPALFFLAFLFLSGSALAQDACALGCSSKVDTTIVGTWELKVPNPLGVSRWVWEIHQDGTYSFHAEGPGAAPAHSGTFAASEGHYTLNSTTLAWNDAGTYQLVSSATLVVTGRLGTGTWQRVKPQDAGDNGL